MFNYALHQTGFYQHCFFCGINHDFLIIFSFTRSNIKSDWYQFFAGDSEKKSAFYRFGECPDEIRQKHMEYFRSYSSKYSYCSMVRWFQTWMVALAKIFWIVTRKQLWTDDGERAWAVKTIMRVGFPADCFPADLADFFADLADYLSRKFQGFFCANLRIHLRNLREKKSAKSAGKTFRATING